MPTIPCPTKIDCLPCNDEPILNISAEASDVDRYISRFSFLNPFPPIRQFPDFDEQGGGIFLQVGCMRWCWSTISQDDADDCARRQAVECAFNPLIPGLPIPDQFHPNRIQLYYNIAVTGFYTCPDGNVFSYTLPANAIAALTQGQANVIAASLAKLRAKQHRVCISDMDDPICVDTWVTKQITASGPNVAVFPATDRWELVSGTIPPGMTLETGFTSDGITLSGIPNTIGEYTFRVRVTISTFGSPGYGDFMEKVFSVKIVGIEQSSPLPDAPLGVAYSQQLSAAFSSNHELETWSITSGSLPDGLTLSTAGLIEGTPTGALAGYSFIVQAQFPVDGTTAVCSKQMTISTVPVLPDAYWKMDELSGDALDATGNGFNLVEQGISPIGSAAGIINTARHFDAAGADEFLLGPNAPTIDLENGLSMAFWVKFDAFAANPNPTNASHPIQYNALTAAAAVLYTFDFTTSGTVPAPITFRFLLSGEGPVNETINGPAITLGTWYFISMVYSRSTGLTTIKINNGAVFSTVSTNPIIFSGVQGINQVVSDQTNAARQADYKIDEVGLWRSGISDATITDIYNAGSGKTCCPFS